MLSEFEEEKFGGKKKISFKKPSLRVGVKLKWIKY